MTALAGEDIVLVGDFREHNGGLIFIRQLGIGIDVRPQLFVEFFLELDQPRIKCRIGPRRVAHLVDRRDPVPPAERPVG